MNDRHSEGHCRILPPLYRKCADSIETKGPAERSMCVARVAMSDTAMRGAFGDAHLGHGQLPANGAYLAAALTEPVGMSTAKRRKMAKIAGITFFPRNGSHSTVRWLQELLATSEKHKMSVDFHGTYVIFVVSTA